MKFFLCLAFIFSFVFVVGQDTGSSKVAETPEGIDASLFNSSLFDGVLEQADTGNPLGTQRIVDKRESIFSPSLGFSTNYNYSSNPLASANDAKVWEDGFLTSFTLGFNLGLGEYALGDEVLLTPSLYLSHSRTYYDIVKDQGSELKYLDADSQIASLSFPFVLPKDFVLRFSHTYFRPIDFRNDKSDIYINSPSFSFEKQFSFSNGSTLTTSVGAGLSISEGSEYLASLRSAGVSDATAQLLYANLVLQGQDPATTRPTNVQDSWNHQIGLTYMHPLSEKLLAMPNFIFSKSVYNEGRYTGREDINTSFGLNFSYSLREWLNLTALSNYTVKKTNDIGKSEDIVNYKNFLGGVAFGINYAF
mgnify:CR=1 FL=1